MDDAAITTIGSAALLLLTIGVLVVRSRRKARRLIRRVDAASTETAAAGRRAERALAGEREAAWAAGTASQRTRRLTDTIGELSTRLANADAALVAAESEIDDLRTSLTRSEHEFATADRDRHSALERLATLETEAAVAARELRSLRASAGESAPADTGSVLRARIAHLEAEVAAAHAGGSLPADPWAPSASGAAEQIARLERELADARLQHQAAVEALQRVSTGRSAPAPAAAGDQGLQAALTRKDAEVAELEERLAALSAARHAEIARLNERMAAMQHLYRDIETRDHRIADLEAALGDVERAVTVDSPVSDQSETAVLEVRRLRHQLDVERARNVRLAQRDPRTGGEAMPPVVPPASPPTPRPDDVTLVKGIGRVIAGILATQGITSLRQIAALGEDDIDRLGPLLPVYPGRIRDDQWVAQARRLLGSG